MALMIVISWPMNFEDISRFCASNSDFNFGNGSVLSVESLVNDQWAFSLKFNKAI